MLVLLERVFAGGEIPGSGALCGGRIGSIVYTVHKRIAKIMNAVHINK